MSSTVKSNSSQRHQPTAEELRQTDSAFFLEGFLTENVLNRILGCGFNRKKDLFFSDQF